MADKLLLVTGGDNLLLDSDAADVLELSRLWDIGAYKAAPAATGDTLLADDVESASEVSTPTLVQVHAILANDVESASSVSVPTLAQVHNILGDDVQSTSEVSTPPLAQAHNTLADDVESTSEVSSPALAQVHILFANDAESASELTTPTLVDSGSTVNPLLAEDVESTSEVSTPTLAQVHVLFANDTESASEVSAPALTEVVGLVDLFADDVESTSEVSTPTLAQVHVLFADDVESASEVLIGSDGAVAPTITVQPIDISVTMPNDGSLYVEAEGYAGHGITIEWYKDDVLIVGETGNTLLLTSLVEGDDGSVYYAIVYDAIEPQNFTQTDSATLSVLPFVPLTGTTIKWKRRHIDDTAPALEDLIEGEVALNTVTGYVYTRDDVNNVVRIGGFIDGSTLPLTDPISAGELWNDSGTVKISTG